MAAGLAVGVARGEAAGFNGAWWRTPWKKTTTTTTTRPPTTTTTTTVPPATSTTTSSTTTTSTTTSTTSSTTSTTTTSTSTTTSSTTTSSTTTSTTTTSTTTTSSTSSTSTTTSTSTTSSTTTTTTLAVTCLDGNGPLLTLTGTWPTAFSNGSLLDATRLDARQATFLPSPTNLYPVNLGGGAGLCFSGGVELGQYDRTLGWDAMHSLNNAGVRFENPGTTVEYVRIDDVTDGIRPIAGPFTIRGVWLSYVRDDCVENDHVQPGVIEDSLFDGCYVALSERPSTAIVSSGYDGRGQLLGIRSSLVRLAPMPGPRGGLDSELGNGQFFKWSGLATDLEVHDTIFMAEQVGQEGASTMGMPDTLTACSDNVMVWLGPGSYPAPLPPCFTVTTDRSVWDRAVADWKSRHGVAP